MSLLAVLLLSCSLVVKEGADEVPKIVLSGWLAAARQ